MKCIKCGAPVIGDNLICDTCREQDNEDWEYSDDDDDFWKEEDEIYDPNDSRNL